MLTGKASLVLVTALSCMSATALADETSFEMFSYSNWPGGKEIAAGDYAAAAAIATRAASGVDRTSALVAATNRCVAYTVSGELATARTACDAAVRRAANLDRAYRSFADKSASARALSNRGVLRARSGDAIGAADDFRKAAKLGGDWAAPSRNLAYLESSPSHRLALAGTAEN